MEHGGGEESPGVDDGSDGFEAIFAGRLGFDADTVGLNWPIAPPQGDLEPATGLDLVGQVVGDEVVELAWGPPNEDDGGDEAFLLVVLFPRGRLHAEEALLLIHGSCQGSGFRVRGQGRGAG